MPVFLKTFSAFCCRKGRWKNNFRTCEGDSPNSAVRKLGQSPSYFSAGQKWFLCRLSRQWTFVTH